MSDQTITIAIDMDLNELDEIRAYAKEAGRPVDRYMLDAALLFGHQYKSSHVATKAKRDKTKEPSIGDYVLAGETGPEQVATPSSPLYVDPGMIVGTPAR
jgi:hypothetical protein